MRTTCTTICLALSHSMLLAADHDHAPDITHWRVAAPDSTVAFHGSSTLHDFDGTATISSGQVDLTPGKENGTVTVSASSMTTGNASRDRRMHSENMQDATYPVIVFAMRSLERKDGRTLAHGTWSMHGVSTPFIIPIVLPSAADAAGSKPHITASFTIDMRRWKIAVPTTAWLIRVKPEISVSVRLALDPNVGPAKGAQGFDSSGKSAPKDTTSAKP